MEIWCSGFRRCIVQERPQKVWGEGGRLGWLLQGVWGGESWCHRAINCARSRRRLHGHLDDGQHAARGHREAGDGVDPVVLHLLPRRRGTVPYDTKLSGGGVLVNSCTRKSRGLSPGGDCLVGGVFSLPVAEV